MGIQVLCCLPDIFVTRKEIIPMCLFLSPHGIVIFLRSIIRLLFQLRKRVAHSSLGSCLVSPVRVDSPELRKVRRPPSLCVR